MTGGETTDDEGVDALATSVVQAVADIIVAVGPGSELIWANRAAEERIGYTTAELQGMPLVDLVHPDDHETALFSLASVITKEYGTLIEIRVKDRGGQYSWYEVRGRRWTHPDHPGSVAIVARESTDRHRWQLGAGDSDQLSAILDAAPNISMFLAKDGTIRGSNRALTRLLHMPLEGTLGRSLLELVAPADIDRVRAEVDALSGTGGTAHFEASFVTGQGGELPLSVTIVDLLADRAVQGFVVAASDITALVEARSELRHLATHDELTGLPNRAHLRERLQHILDSTDEPTTTLLFADVDGLKAVNDHHGHRAGDAVLTEIAERLRSVTRSEDFVARLSGDEFVMVIAGAGDDDVAGVQARIDEVIGEPYALPDGTRVKLSLSCGAAPAAPGLTAEDLLAAADAAMYVAKRQRDR